MTQATPVAQFNEVPNVPQTPWAHLSRRVFGRAAVVAMIVGSVLTLVNQPGVLFDPQSPQLLPFVMVYLTPFVVVAISQILGARQAATDAGSAAVSGKPRLAAVESFATTAFSHKIPIRAALVALFAGGVNTAIVVIAAEHASLGALPLPLLGQAFTLPVLFGVVSQAAAYRRAIKLVSQHLGAVP